MQTHLTRLFRTACLVLMVAACSTPASDSAFDPNFDEGTPAVITSVSPADEHFAGLETITINGSDFGSDANSVTVWFNNVKANVLTLNTNQIVVRTPFYVADSINIKIAKNDVVAFSNSVPYKLKSLVEEYTKLPSNNTAFGAGVAANGDYFVSLLASNTPNGVGRFNADGAVNAAFVPVQGWAYRVVKVGPDNGVYMLRVAGGVPIIYRSGPIGGAPTSWGTGVGRAEDLDFDENNFMWVVGANETNTVANQSIVRVQDLGASRAYVRYPFVANGHSVKVYNNFLYVGGTRAGIPYIWRFPINNDNTLGSEEQVVNLGTTYATDIVPRSIMFSTDGTMFVSVSGAVFDALPAGRQPLLRVTPNGGVSEHYPGIIPGIILKTHWIPGSQYALMTVLPATPTGGNRLIRLNMLKDGAPYFGIE